MNYYNEIEPYAAQWLRNLIEAGLIPRGDVDERSIEDVQPDDLKGYTQCHFFAGIGGWPLALALAEWPEDRAVWTGSCPCQPFSSAGKQKGTADERHLWPTWFRLIDKCKPPIVFGEQVASAIRHGWLDDVFDDMEGIGYACGASVLPACSVNAPHCRDRLWFVANTRRAGWSGHRQEGGISCAVTKEIAISSHAITLGQRALAGDHEFLLSDDGLSIGVERAAIKGYGNAIVPQVAARFIQAFDEARMSA